MYAVLDLGSNSFHLVVAEKSDSGVRIVHTYNKKVQLAEGLNENGKISRAARERALKTFAEIRAELTPFSLSLFCVVGTNTFREAKNAARLMEEANALGFPINVISGLQEAYYIYRGAQSFLPASAKPRLVFDIGGGSTEFAIGSGAEPVLLDSIPLGCVTSRFVDAESNEKITRKQLARLRRRTHKVLDKYLNPAFYETEWADCFASSGTAKMLSMVLRENNLTDGTITETALQELETLVIELGHVNALEKLAGLKANRRNVFTSGLAIMQSVVDHLGIDHVEYSDFALREGVLLSMVQQGSDFSLYTLHGDEDEGPRLL